MKSSIGFPAGSSKGMSASMLNKRLYLSSPGIDCFLGDGVYRVSDCEAKILCGGRPGQECTEFSGDASQYTVYILKVAYCLETIPRETAYLEKYIEATGKWQQMDTHPGESANGWVWVSWIIYPNRTTERWRIRWGACTKEWRHVTRGCQFDGWIKTPKKVGQVLEAGTYAKLNGVPMKGAVQLKGVEAQGRQIVFTETVPEPNTGWAGMPMITLGYEHVGTWRMSWYSVENNCEVPAGDFVVTNGAPSAVDFFVIDQTTKKNIKDALVVLESVSTGRQEKHTDTMCSEGYYCKNYPDTACQNTYCALNFQQPKYGESYNLTITAPGYEDVIIIGGYWVTAAKGAYGMSLKPLSILTGSIAFSSIPQGAEIFLDGQDQSLNTPATTTDVPAGSHTYALKLAGYNDYTGTVHVSAGQTAQVSATLAPVTITGMISISSSPSGARVYLDGTDKIVTTPTVLIGISPGSHVLKLTLAGYKDATQTVTVTAGQTTPISIFPTPVSLPCTPNWQCETGGTGYETDGCGNKRQNPACAAVPPAETPSKAGIYLAVGTAAVIVISSAALLSRRK